MRTLAALRSVAAVTIAGSALSLAGPARADEKDVCLAAYEQTQSLKSAGKLGQAREAAQLCLRPVCPALARTDCARWLGEIEASQPTVVFDVKDAKGNDTTQVTVSLDGKPWLTEVGGQAKPIDPGDHTLRFETPGSPPREQHVVIREAEKGRRIGASFQVGGARGDVVAPPPSRGLGPWILGGAGVALAGVGVALGVVVLGAKSDVDAACPNGVCRDAATVKKEDGPKNTVNTVGPISTVCMVLGGAAIGGAIVWLVTGPSSRPRAAGIAPMIAPGAGGLTMRGDF